MQSFQFSATPTLYFGENSINTLTKVVDRYGRHILLITGKQSFQKLPNIQNVLFGLKQNDVKIEHYQTSGEPTVDQINACIDLYKNAKFDCIVAIGGGSILDTGKALSAMLPVGDKIENYLEGLPTYRPHPGTKIPFIAVPTTAGTGSEATKNAVISKNGINGFKRSIRHDNFIANIAIIDPVLHVSCPGDVTAASGLDALTQLVEAYLSTQANEITDALALKGIELVSQSLLKAYFEPNNLMARANMALAAYLSGIVLANAGLGVVHGFASSIGGMFNIPHGVICGRLFPICFRTIVFSLTKGLSNNDQLITKKLEKLASCFIHDDRNLSFADKLTYLCNEFDKMREIMRLPNLVKYGITHNHVKAIAENTSLKNNPVHFNTETLISILETELAS